MTTDLTTRITELTAAIEERLAQMEGLAEKAEPWPFVPIDTAAAISGPNAGFVWAHLNTHGPAAVLRHVKATRSLVAAILARPHVLDDSEWYGCHAITHSFFAADGSRYPEPDGRYVPTERECTCGRDEDVAKLLGIIASEWEEQ